MKKKPGCGSKINSFLIAFKTMEISGQKELIIVHNVSSVIIGNHFDKWDIQFELEDILEFIKLNKNRNRIELIF